MSEHGIDVELVAGPLRELGVKAGDALALHSSVPSLGKIMVQVFKQGGGVAVEQAVNKIIDGFLNAVNPNEGTLCVPTFSYCYAGPKDAIPFDPEVTPSKVGMLSDIFFRRRDAIRSQSPTHSVAAIGTRAEELIRNHDCASPLDAGTPFHRLAEWDGWICYLGTNGNTLSLLHVAEAIAEVPYMATLRYAYLGWRKACLIRRPDGILKELPMTTVPGCSEHFHRFDTLANDAGITRTTRIYQSKVVLFKAMDALELTVQKLRKEPDFFLCPKGTCKACDAAWAVV